jgi:hypothetical protein
MNRYEIALNKKPTDEDIKFGWTDREMALSNPLDGLRLLKEQLKFTFTPTPIESTPLPPASAFRYRPLKTSFPAQLYDSTV